MSSIFSGLNLNIPTPNEAHFPGIGLDVVVAANRARVDQLKLSTLRQFCQRRIIG
jgi:hypothetical protein